MTVATDTDLARRIDELDQKVDRLLLLIEEERSARSGLGDLLGESAPIARSAFERLALTLDRRDIDMGELGELALRLAEAAPELNRGLESIEAITGLLDDVGALSGDAFELLAARLDELDRRGYFGFAKGGMEVIDRIVTSFDEEDIQALGDNVVLIFETVKEMTQPDIMRMLQRSARLVREDAEPGKLSLFRLLREMRDPDVKLGIHRMLTLLRGMAMNDGAEPPQITETPQTESSTKEER